MDSLKLHLREYREIDNEIRDLNKELYEKRKIRTAVEQNITQILVQPQFDEYKKLKLEDDDSYFRIQRPNTYQKPWSLSKTDLKTLLTEYFQSTKTPNAEDCNKYICEKRKIMATEFSITRILPNENV